MSTLRSTVLYITETLCYTISDEGKMRRFEIGVRNHKHRKNTWQGVDDEDEEIILNGRKINEQCGNKILKWQISLLPTADTRL